MADPIMKAKLPSLQRHHSSAGLPPDDTDAKCHMQLAGTLVAKQNVGFPSTKQK